MPTFGCAYWGRDARLAERDLAPLPELGFSWIVIPVSTERMRYDRAGAAAVIVAAKRNGLVTRIAPWGVGGLFGQIAAEQGVSQETVERDFIATHRPTSLIRRLASVKEVANLCVYLASEQASATTGAAMRVDGGVVRSIA